MLREKETLGRLYLWRIAINRISDLLELRLRVDRFFDSGRPQNITELYDEERARLKVSVRLEGEALDSFESKYGSLFPDIHDVQLINELITEEIIIKFCTIFNDGYGKAGIISENKKAFWEPILDEIISGAFSADARELFYQFCEQARAYRNQQGAHYDQQSFYLEHGCKQPNEDGVIFKVGWTNALFSFDWAYIAETIPRFSKSLNFYIKKLQKQASFIL